MKKDFFLDYFLELFYGNFIQQIINFLLIAFSLFVMVKTINTIREKSDEAKRKLIEERINRKEKIEEEIEKETVETK